MVGCSQALGYVLVAARAPIVSGVLSSQGQGMCWHRQHDASVAVALLTDVLAPGPKSPMPGLRTPASCSGVGLTDIALQESAEHV